MSPRLRPLAAAREFLLERLKARPRVPSARAQRVRFPSTGQALVELAIVVPIFLLMLGAALDLGRLFYAYVAVENAAKEGAFYGATNPRCDAVKGGCVDPNTVDWHVRAELSNVPLGSLTVDCLDGASGTTKAVTACVENDTYRVQVTHTFRFLTPLLSAILGNQLTLHTTSTSTVLNLAFQPGSTPPPAPGCGPGQTAVPNLVGMTVSDARSLWNSQFSGGFTPPNGLNNKTVTSQTTSPPSGSGECAPTSSSVTVTYE